VRNAPPQLDCIHDGWYGRCADPVEIGAQTARWDHTRLATGPIPPGGTGDCCFCLKGVTFPGNGDAKFCESGFDKGFEIFGVAAEEVNSGFAIAQIIGRSCASPVCYHAQHPCL
jgi:hypothetical protein